MIFTFTQYKPWMIEQYGEPLFRIPIEIASHCPHGQCSFCSEKGARAQQTQKHVTALEQAEAAIQFSKRRYHAKKFMLYIQAFTTDLTDLAQQQLIFQCLEKFDFEVISMGNRPDSLPPTALDFLEQLNAQIEVWVELGVQTSNDITLKKINRGHDWACSKQAILDLSNRGIHVAPHVILGLPGEQAEPAPTQGSTPWSRTAEELAKLPISGIKIHNLHIVKGTALADNPPPVLNHWEYAEGLIDFLRRIPADIPVMRLCTDTPDDELIAPRWHLEKGQFLDYVIEQMQMREIRQGDFTEIGRLGNSKFGVPNQPINEYPIVQTKDGSITFFNPYWKEHYHTKAGARFEAQKKFVESSGLNRKLQNSDLKLLDICFGLGNNSLAALCAQRADKNVCSTGEADILADHSNQLDITALEMDKRVVRAASEKFHPLETDPVHWNEVLSELLQHSTFHLPHATISLLWGDARWLIQGLKDESFDILFQDPFSSQHCPELWTVEFFKQLYRVMKPDGVLLTYSSALPVRGAMREAGFWIAGTDPGYSMGNGTIAVKPGSPLGLPKLETLDPRRSIPYRDPYLCATSKTILRQRQEAVEAV